MTRRQTLACRYLVFAALLAFHSLPPCPAASQPLKPFVMATDQPDTTYEGRWQRLVFQEAFRRLGIPVEIELMPAQRVSAMVDAGAVDGQTLRVFDYADKHPEQVRVEEPVSEVRFALWVNNPALTLARLQDLTAKDWIGIHRRGVELCQRALSSVTSPDRLSTVSTEQAGLRMLLKGRIDYYCEMDVVIQNALHSPEFKASASVRPILAIGDRIMLYPYLYKTHAELAPRLAVVLNGMKTEGLLERFRQDALEK